jgi:hypothetical protein
MMKLAAEWQQLEKLGPELRLADVRFTFQGWFCLRSTCHSLCAANLPVFT